MNIKEVKKLIETNANKAYKNKRYSQSREEYSYYWGLYDGFCEALDIIVEKENKAKKEQEELDKQYQEVFDDIKDAANRAWGAVLEKDKDK